MGLGVVSSFVDFDRRRLIVLDFLAGAGFV